MARRSSDCQEKDDIYAVIASLKRAEIDTLIRVFDVLDNTRFIVKDDAGEELMINAIPFELFAEMASIYKKIKNVREGRKIGKNYY